VKFTVRKTTENLFSHQVQKKFVLISGTVQKLQQCQYAKRGRVVTSPTVAGVYFTVQIPLPA